jgi:endoglucanase
MPVSKFHRTNQIRRSSQFIIVLLLALGAFLGVIIPSCGKLLSVQFSQTLDEVSSYIFVDQFGYRPEDPKVALIVQSEPDPEIDDRVSFAHLSDRYQVLQIDSKDLIYEGNAEIWQDGKIHSQSGDRAAWFDFSLVTKPGSYIIKNSRTGEISGTFEIAENIYREVLIAATRMFFYQRSGVAKQPPYADAKWSDAAAFMGPGQDTEARFVNDKDNLSLERDMSGGWFDAGDTNKYVTFASPAVHQLLDAYTQNSSIWSDDFNIPESGNNIPDLIDEIKYELDWLIRMQDEDGGAFIKLGNINFEAVDRPSLNKQPRYYAPKCSSATIDMAGMFSHAALVFQDITPLSTYANDLQQRAIKAWDWYGKHPQEANCDTQEIMAGDADRSLEQQTESTLVAAVYLFALTGDNTYNTYITDHYGDSCLYCHETWYPYHAQLGDALIYYTQLEQSALSIRNELLKSITQLAASSATYGANNTLDPYRAYIPDDQYHWGSNAIKAHYGMANYDAYLLSTNSLLRDDYRTRALDCLHYFHGVNPLNLVYLTNMYSYGAEKSANEMHHDWFGHGIYSNALTSPSGPAPGYITGGPNKNYTGEADIPLKYPMRAYLDSNNNKYHEMKMWEITEPAIYYQSAYLKLLARFCT